MESRIAAGLDPNILHRVVTVEADTVHVEKMKHRATVHGFTFYSDEPSTMEGEDQHPYPLDYLTAAIGM